MAVQALFPFQLVAVQALYPFQLNEQERAVWTRQMAWHIATWVDKEVVYDGHLLGCSVCDLMVERTESLSPFRGLRSAALAWFLDELCTAGILRQLTPGNFSVVPYWKETVWAEAVLPACPKPLAMPDVLFSELVERLLSVQICTEDPLPTAELVARLRSGLGEELTPCLVFPVYEDELLLAAWEMIAILNTHAAPTTPTDEEIDATLAELNAKVDAFNSANLVTEMDAQALHAQLSDLQAAAARAQSVRKYMQISAATIREDNAALFAEWKKRPRLAGREETEKEAEAEVAGS